MKPVYLLIFLIFSLAAQAERMVVLKGNVADAPAQMYFHVSDEGDVFGTYFYTKTNRPIRLRGTLSGADIRLEAKVEKRVHETFVGVASLVNGEISALSGKWYGEHFKQGESPQGYDFFFQAVANPLSDHVLTCDEMENSPDILMADIDLGSGSGSPNQVAYDCPKSMGNIDFLQELFTQTSSIRGDYSLPQHCTGTIIHAQARWFRYGLNRLGYYPQGFAEPRNNANRNTTNMAAYFLEWSYYSLHNRAVYDRFKETLAAVRPKLVAWYLTNHSVSDAEARRYADAALLHIADYGFGGYPYDWQPEPLVPGTPEAVEGDYALLLKSLPQSSDPQKINSLRRLLVHRAAPEVVTALVRSIGNKQMAEGAESPISLAVFSADAVVLLINEGFDPNHANEFGKTPLFYAIQFNQYEAARVLLESGAKVNQAYQAEDVNEWPWSCIGITGWGRTPLMHAAQHSDVEMLQMLLEGGAKLDAQDVNGATALDYAKQNGKAANAEFLSAQQR